MEWQPIETAPKDGTPVLVWYDHSADPYYEPNDPHKLTNYATWAEGGEFLDGSGVTVAKWCEQFWEVIDDYGDGYWLPAAWFTPGNNQSYECVCNPTGWMPLPAPPVAS